MAKILVVEDDENVLASIAEWLRSERHLVETLTDGSEASRALKLYSFDLLVLDWGLPGTSGLELVRELRSRADRTPVLMLTGKAELAAKEQGLDSGADDYLTKPFEPRELSARIRALIRRASNAAENTLKIDRLALEPDNHRVLVEDKELQLSPKEFALLEFLLRHPDKVFSGDALLNRVWASDSEASPSTVKACVHTLRRKLSEHGLDWLVETVHGLGYKLTNKR